MLQFQPSLEFHPAAEQLLVTSSFGDVVSWSYELDSGEETQTVMNTEHDEIHDLEFSTKKESVGEAAHRRAKALETAIYSECKGCTGVIAIRSNYTKFTADGLLVVSTGRLSKQIDIYLARNGDPVCSVPLENSYGKHPPLFRNLVFSQLTLH